MNEAVPEPKSFADVATIVRLSDVAAPTQCREAEYRRGYRDGYIAAYNDLAAVPRTLIGLCLDAMWEHWEGALLDWLRGARQKWALPPRLRLLCAYCGRSAATVDHVVPWAQGGTDATENVVPCCRRCNSRKGARTPAAWQQTLELGRAVLEE